MKNNQIEFTLISYELAINECLDNYKAGFITENELLSQITDYSVRCMTPVYND